MNNNESNQSSANGKLDKTETASIAQHTNTELADVHKVEERNQILEMPSNPATQQDNHHEVSEKKEKETVEEEDKESLQSNGLVSLKTDNTEANERKSKQEETHDSSNTTAISIPKDEAKEPPSVPSESDITQLTNTNIDTVLLDPTCAVSDMLLTSDSKTTLNGKLTDNFLFDKIQEETNEEE